MLNGLFHYTRTISRYDFFCFAFIQIHYFVQGPTPPFQNTRCPWYDISDIWWFPSPSSRLTNISSFQVDDWWSSRTGGATNTSFTYMAWCRFCGLRPESNNEIHIGRPLEVRKCASIERGGERAFSDIPTRDRLQPPTTVDDGDGALPLWFSSL